MSLSRSWAVRAVATILGCAGLALAWSGCRRQADAPVVVVYCSADQEFAEPILAEFQKQTGIVVQARYDSEASKTVGLVQRLRAEAATPLADVFWSSEIFHTARLAEEGLLQPERSTALGPCSIYCDGGGRWHGFALRARVIAYSTRRVSESDAPACLEDLLAAKWKGRIVMAWPASGTTGGDVASWFVHYGPDKARQILQSLAANEVRMVDSNSTAVRMVATGQADVALTDTDDVYAAQRNGWPVAMRLADQAGEGTLVIPNTAAVIARCPHPQAAQKLVEFLLSPQAQRMLAQSDSHNTPVDADLAKEFARYAIPHPLRVDYAKVAQVLPTAIASATEILKR